MAVAIADPDSIVWTPEEVPYVRAVLSWESLRSGEGPKRRGRNGNGVQPKPMITKAPIGEFRVLVIGAKGTGKTSILTRFCKGRLPEEGESREPFCEQGCRHIVQVEDDSYIIDALEMPSKHLWRNDLIQQAINITEAALLVYDVTAPDSLRLTQGLQDLIRDTVGHRDYGITLVGNKSDVDDEERLVAWSVGSKTASTFQLRSSFVEVSARTGDNIPLVFSHAGKNILTLRRINQQRKEHAERLRMEQEAKLVRKKLGLWKRISRPFFRREVAQL